MKKKTIENGNQTKASDASARSSELKAIRKTKENDEQRKIIVHGLYIWILVLFDGALFTYLKWIHCYRMPRYSAQLKIGAVHTRVRTQ